MNSADRPVRAAVYIRVSSAGQEDNFSLPTQERSCREYAGERGWAVVEVYRDVYTGAAVFERPGLTRLRADMRDGRFDVLVVHALDRLSRDQNHLGLVLSEAEHAGVEWHSATEDVDNSPVGKMLRAVIGGVAELERLKIAERTQRGKRARVEAGKYQVGCRAPYGYRWRDADKSGLVEDPLTAPVVRRIFADLAGGGSARRTALALSAEGVPTPTGRSGVWHVSTVRSMILNPLYAGHATAFRWSVTHRRGRRNQRERAPEDRVPLPGAAPALVSPELAATARDRLSRNKREATRNNRNPEAALLRGGYALCGYCGKAMRVDNRGSLAYYRCNTSSRDAYGCPCHVISTHILDGEVWSRIVAALADPRVIAREVERLRREDPAGPDIAGVDARLEEIGRRRANLARRVAGLEDDDLAGPLLEEMASLSRQHRALAEEREGLRARREAWREAESRLDSLEERCAAIAESIRDAGYQERRLALYVLGVQARVWSSDHDPRFEVTMNVALDPVSDPRPESGGGHVGVHVDARIHCADATPAARPADPPRTAASAS